VDKLIIMRTSRLVQGKWGFGTGDRHAPLETD
jgi:hypothetical protein